jgi:phosphoesterase RecJ-like protein
MAAAVRSSPAKKVCIDHHPNPEIEGVASLVDPSASATGVLIFEILERLLGHVPADAVDPLYVALMTDTGSFRFGNTDRRTLEIAAELVDRGARPDRLYEAVYETSSASRLRLLGEVLTQLTFELDGRLVYYTIDRTMLERTGASVEDAEGFTDIVRAAEKSEVVLSFLETHEGGVKVSLRSKGRRVDVSRIAAPFGGGGHANASGILTADPLDTVRAQVLAVVRGVLEGNLAP